MCHIIQTSRGDPTKLKRKLEPNFRHYFFAKGEIFDMNDVDALHREWGTDGGYMGNVVIKIWNIHCVAHFHLDMSPRLCDLVSMSGREVTQPRARLMLQELMQEWRIGRKCNFSQPPHRSEQEPSDRPHFWSPPKPSSIACGATARFISVWSCVMSSCISSATIGAPSLACHKGGEREEIEEGKKTRIGILGAWEGGRWKEPWCEKLYGMEGIVFNPTYKFYFFRVYRGRCTEQKGCKDPLNFLTFCLSPLITPSLCLAGNLAHNFRLFFPKLLRSTEFH